jgi:EAL domain-containing protein (putative c-di-GMP-specific phosphodiesterase class I)
MDRKWAMGKANDCLVCSHQHVCDGDSILLFAAMPILRQIVDTHLRDMGVSFAIEGELFRIHSGSVEAVEGLRRRLSATERSDLRVSRGRGAALLGASSLEEYGQRLDSEWFETALRDDAYTIYFQPIVDATNLSVFAHECLIRLVADRLYSGGEILEAALSRGSVHLFDSYARQLCIRKAGEQHIPGTKVFINFMPSSIYDPAFCMASTLQAMSTTSLLPGDIVFEVVESEKVQDVKHLQKICEYYRKQGFGFALDDVGSGSNSLQMVCDLKPDYVKLDKSLISRVADPMYRTAVEKLAEFANLHGLQVIAEGIETAATFETLRQTGIHLMQGYYFARPAPRMISLEGSHSSLIQIASHVGFRNGAQGDRAGSALPAKTIPE